MRIDLTTTNNRRLVHKGDNYEVVADHTVTIVNSTKTAESISVAVSDITCFPAESRRMTLTLHQAHDLRDVLSEILK